MNDTAPTWRRYLRFWRTDPASDVDEELRFHLESLIGEYEATGLPHALARDKAFERFGNVTTVATTCHTLVQQRETTMQRSETLSTIAQDLRFSIRQLRKNRMLTIVATLTIALGVGANSAIFSVVDAVLLRALPYAKADRLMYLSEFSNRGEESVSVGNFTDWHSQNHSFESLAAVSGTSLTLTGACEGGGCEPQRLAGARVSGDYFRARYMPPELGRYILPEESEAGARHVVVISHELWQGQFGGERNILGRDIELSGEKYTVIGVTPPGYRLRQTDAQLWIPAAFTPKQLAEHDEHYLDVYGVLKPGVTLATATRDLSAIQHEEPIKYPDTGSGDQVKIQSLHDVIVQDYKAQLLILLGAVTFVLLIACGNVANLLLARAAVRAKEMAIRTALGAGRGRIIRQLLTESIVLAIAGGLLGLVIAHFGIRFLVTVNPANVPRLAEAGLDARVVTFTLLVTLVCGVIFGLAPALRAARPNVQSTLREGGRGSAGVARDRLRNSLVISEIAVALVLLVGAGLLIRSAMEISQLKPGFDTNNVLSFRISLPAAHYKENAEVTATFDRIIAEIGNVPGVSSAALVSSAPFTNGGQNGLIPEGRPREISSAITSALRLVTPNYFQTMHVPLKMGRTFTLQDVGSSPRVMVINETLAKLAFPGQNPIGKRIECCDAGPTGGPGFKEIVGVVGDVRAWGLANPINPEFYLPMAQGPSQVWEWLGRGMTVVARTSGDPVRLTKALQRAVWNVDPTVPIYQVATLDEMMGKTTASTRFNMLLLMLLGLTGLVLAAVGIYGVIAYFVSQRTHEIGIRMALGATANDVRSMVVRQGAVLAVTGVAVGVVLSLLLTRLLASLLFGVSPHDPLTIGAVALTLAGVAIAASWIPARRATRVGPTEALRSS
jgi:putative ABC transport system permease protein